jgi:nicotinamidase-related amidase
MTMKAKQALLVVDVLQGGDDDTVYDPAVAAFSQACERVTDAFRAAGLPVILACDAHLPGIDHELTLWGDHGIKGSAAAQPADFLHVAGSDIIVPKRRYDAFFDTDLDLTLRELGVEELVVIGCDTNICVLHTLAGAFYRGYATTVVEDATRTFLVGTQEGGIEYFKTCFGSRIVTADEVVAELDEPCPGGE